MIKPERIQSRAILESISSLLAVAILGGLLSAPEDIAVPVAVMVVTHDGYHAGVFGNGFPALVTGDVGHFILNGHGVVSGGVQPW